MPFLDLGSLTAFQSLWYWSSKEYDIGSFATSSGELGVCESFSSLQISLGTTWLWSWSGFPGADPPLHRGFFKGFTTLWKLILPSDLHPPRGSCDDVCCRRWSVGVDVPIVSQVLKRGSFPYGKWVVHLQSGEPFSRRLSLKKWLVNFVKDLSFPRGVTFRKHPKRLTNTYLMMDVLTREQRKIIFGKSWKLLATSSSTYLHMIYLFR